MNHRSYETIQAGHNIKREAMSLHCDVLAIHMANCQVYVCSAAMTNYCPAIRLRLLVMLSQRYGRDDNERTNAVR